MATREAPTNGVEEFRVEPAANGYSGGPGYVLVQVSEGVAGEKFAILAAGDEGRYSFDFRFVRGGVEIERAYGNGKRIEQDEVPKWVGAVKSGIAEKAFAR